VTSPKSLLALLCIPLLLAATAATVVPVPGPVHSPSSLGGGHEVGLSGALRMMEDSGAMRSLDGAPIAGMAFVPLRAKTGATWRGYRIGFWPGERRLGSRIRYPLPNGFLEVTPESQDLQVSAHFRVRDFLTHDQSARWPKVLVLHLRLVDKLELISERLAALGRPSTLRVMSGFRTPQYNALGVGRRGGRAQDSRHMYGDAADIYVDGDGNGRMDDLNRDGRVTIEDARWLAGIAAQVEAQHPELAGGIGVYGATSTHGPFVHVDARGTPARW